jgi:chaperonin GroEL
MTVKSNVLAQTDTSMTISETLEVLAGILSKSLGPYGSTTIIQDKLSMNHTVTKDGYTILNKIKFDNEVSTTILEFVKTVSRSLVREVGDGSTSAIIVSDSLFRGLNEIIDAHNVPRKDIIDVLSYLEELLTASVKEHAIPITDKNFEKVKNIAAVSNNNDDKAGDLIYSIYEKIGANGFISLELSNDIEDSYEISEGMELPRGHISNLFANKPDKVTADFEKPLVFISNQMLDENDMSMLSDIVGDVCLKLKRPLVVISKGYDIEIKNFFHINKTQHRELDVTVVDYAIVSDHHRESLEDLAAYLGAEIYDKFEEGILEKFPMTRLGMAERSIVNEISTKFIKGGGTEEKIQERVTLIEEKIEEVKKKEKFIDTSEEMFQLRKRIADLNCKIATLRVGGKTDLEKETRKFLMEDAVFASQSALKHGYVSGGNLIIPRVMHESWEVISANIFDNKDLCRTLTDPTDRKIFIEGFLLCVNDAFKHSFRTVLANRGDSDGDRHHIVDTCIENDTIFDLKTNEYENLKDTAVINSVMTDIEIMKATFSIIGLLVTSNQFVSVQYQGESAYR